MNQASNKKEEERYYQLRGLQTIEQRRGTFQPESEVDIHKSP